MTDRPHIHCGHCDGTGRVPLPQHLWDTYHAIPRAQHVTASQVAKRLGLKFTTVNNRLVALETLGMVWRMETGPTRYKWSRAPLDTADGLEPHD